MPVTTETTSTNGNGTLSARRQKAAAPSVVQRHRQVPWIVAGVLLVVGCALAFGVASVRASHGEQVLAVARSVPAGHVVQPGDLRVVNVTPTAGLDPVLAVSESSSVGRPAAVALVAGTLLTPADLGTPSGRNGDVVAVALKAGAYPPSLGPGGRVDVVPVVGGSSSGSTPISGQSSSIGAVVLSVDATPAGSSADAVVSLQVNPADADEVAALAAAGQIALVELPSGSGS